MLTHICAAVLKKAQRPKKAWEELAPSVDRWYQEVDAILKTLLDRGVGAQGADMEKVQR